jgi:hypothetical protein
LLLPVTALSAVAFAPFFPENQHLFRLTLTHDLTGNLGITEEGKANICFTIIGNKQDVCQRHLITGVSGELFYSYNVSLRDTVLFATSPNHSVLHGLVDIKNNFLKQSTSKVNQMIAASSTLSRISRAFSFDS